MGLFNRIHVHLPFPRLRERLPLLLERRLNPEIYLPQETLRPIIAGEAADLALAIAAAGLQTTVHGPFADLSPGAADPEMRALTLENLRATLLAVLPFDPTHVVFHPGYDPLGAFGYPTIWLQNSIHSWKDLLPFPAGLGQVRLLIENIFEPGPEMLADLLDKLPSPPFGFCFDTGHFQIFSRRPLADWISVLGPWLYEVHLHDNAGSADDHLPPGEGLFDFPSLFRLLSPLPHPVIGTLEMHNEPDIRQALRYLGARGIL